MLKTIWFFSNAMLLSFSVQAASFNCQKAQEPLEHTICDNKTLSQLDSQLGTVYKNLLEKQSKKQVEFLKKAQRYWAFSREEKCGSSNGSCLIDLYKQRLETLDFFASKEYETTETAKVSGIYHVEPMELLVEALSETQLAVYISGAEPTNARWICDFSGQGTLQKNALHINADEHVVNINLFGNQATVNTTGESEGSFFCGMGGSIDGKYLKEK